MNRTRARATKNAAQAASLLAPFAARLFTLLLVTSISVFAQSKATTTAETVTTERGAEVRLTVTVSDAKGSYATGLTKADFAVTDGGSPREISFFSEEDEPLSVIFVMDVSGSMDQKRVAKAQRIAARFVEASGPQNEYAIMEFGARGRGVMDWASTRAEVGEGLSQVGLGREKKSPLGGNTALYAAVDAALDKLATAHHRKRVVLLVSDGQDNASRITLKDLTRRERVSDVLIYAFGVTERDNPGTLDANGQAILDEVASVSGGRAFFAVTLAEALEVAERTAIELRHQYVIGFVPPDSAAGKEEWRKVKIKVLTHSKEYGHLFARSKDGYLSTGAKP